MAALRIWRRLQGDEGAELIEFALVFPMLLLVAMGIIDFGLLFQKYEVVTNAAREGGRVGVLDGYTLVATPPATISDVEQRVQDYLDAGGLDHTLATVDPVTATPVEAVTGACMNVITVTVHYPHTYNFVGGVMSFFGSGITSTSLTATAKMRTESASVSCP